MHRDKLKLLLHPSLVLDGCTLVAANDRNKAADMYDMAMLNWLLPVQLLPY